MGKSSGHTPLSATPERLARFPGKMLERSRTAFAMIATIDDGVGRIMESLRTHGLEKNSLIVFTSDNGAPLKMTMTDALMTSGPDGKQIESGGWDGSMNESPLGDGTDFLFDLTQPDPETKKLAADHPEKVAELRSKLEAMRQYAWRKIVGIGVLAESAGPEAKHLYVPTGRAQRISAVGTALYRLCFASKQDALYSENELQKQSTPAAFVHEPRGDHMRRVLCAAQGCGNDSVQRQRLGR